MQTTTEAPKLHGISQLLVHEELLKKEDALKHQQEAQKEKVPFLHYLITNSVLNAGAVALRLAENFGVPLLDLNAIDLNNSPLALVNEKLIQRHMILPLFTRGNNLYIATDDPSKHASLKEIQFHTGLHSHAIIVESDKLYQAIDDLINQKGKMGLDEFEDDGMTDLESLEISSEEDEAAEDSTEAGKDDAPIVKFVNKILIDAIKGGVSDIHFEPFESEYRVRYRQDGILNVIASPPISLSGRITARIKVMSNLDISERRVPQDGRFKMRLSKTRAIDFRVSTCPTVGGEKVVMRILDPGSTKLGIEKLGFSETQQKHFKKAINKPQGMILVTGPTGSGKTVTLYTALGMLNTKERNISTAEDPVEIKVPGINQVNINLKAGLDFASALRSFLRQDPDIIMVGEIRDLDTAEIAVKAAQTGHLVLSTLHTNSSAETLTRLVNMGVPSFNIASSVSIIIAQRLARRLCDACREPIEDIPPDSLIELGFSEEDAQIVKPYRAVGCNQCNNGFRGRVGLFEVMPMSKDIGRIIMSGGNSLDILNQSTKEGMLTIFQSGLVKIKEGVTTIEEVNRVTVD